MAENGARREQRSPVDSLDSAITRADTLARELEGRGFGLRRITDCWLAGVPCGDQTAYGGIGETPGEAVERSLAKLLRAAAIRGVAVAAMLLLAVASHGATPAAARRGGQTLIYMNGSLCGVARLLAWRDEDGWVIPIGALVCRTKIEKPSGKATAPGPFRIGEQLVGFLCRLPDEVASSPVLWSTAAHGWPNDPRDHVACRIEPHLTIPRYREAP